MSVEDGLRRALHATHEIERELGGGGMSRLFVANEIALGRPVVIKVLPEELVGESSVDRFRREVTVAARLQHPLIVPVLGAGQCEGLPYFIMPLVAGESLRDRLNRESVLSLHDVVRIGGDVVRALAHAHANGIVHRDVKPENILLSNDHALVTDFGVAKALASSSSATNSDITRVGTIVGTLAYMAPEQAAADPATDHRADLYAFGIVLYEMLCGATPFAGKAPQALLAAHASMPPEPIDRRRPKLPIELVALVHGLLEKQPDDRPATADVVASLEQLNALTLTGLRVTRLSWRPLQRLSRRSAVLAMSLCVALLAVAGWRLAPAMFTRGEIPLTAVLPFDNVGGDSVNIAFADGMADELIAALGHTPGVRVMGRNSSFTDRIRHADAKEIGRALGAASYVSGSVRHGNGMVRVVAQLASTSTGAVLWSDTYDRPLADIFRVQDEIVRAIAVQLRATLSTDTTSSDAKGTTTNMEAYRLYLDGKQKWAMRGSTNLLAAADLFHRAEALDSGFARAKAGLALVYVILPGNDIQFQTVADSVINIGVDYANKALAISPNDREARLALAFAKSFRWDWAGAEADFRKVLQYDPSNATAHTWYGMQLTGQNRLDEAIEQLQRAVELDPLSQVAARNLAAAQMAAHRFDDAYATDKRMLLIDTTATRANVAMLQAAMFAKRYDEAYSYADRLDSLGVRAVAHLERSLVHARSGKRTEALAELDLARKSNGVGRSDLAFAYGLLGQADSAFTILNDVVDHKGNGLIDNMQICLPYFEPLWPDARFVAITKRMNIAMCGQTGSERR